MVPRSRLDALSDGIFAVAMTLLVLELALPEGLELHTSQDLLDALLGLLPKFFPYVVSFWVLGHRWHSSVRSRHRSEHARPEQFNWWLLYHLLITLVPFTTMVVGRYPALPPAVWLYAGNTILIALATLRLAPPASEAEDPDAVFERWVSTWILLAACLAALGWTFISPRWALFLMVLNVVPSRLVRLVLKKPARTPRP